MICIQIAGAGAGKTYGLAQKIKDKMNELDEGDSRKIYALTYTNSARDKIKSELENHFVVMPENIQIDTVHSFLINEVVFTFSKYVLGCPYNRVSLEKLPEENIYKQARISKLKNNKIIHVEKVYNTSKQILDRTNSKHGNKYKKSKVDYVNELISSLIYAIFIDEVQDLDDDCLKIFQILGERLYVYMIGDPKQAIKYPNSFSSFFNKYNLQNEEMSSIIIEPINNNTRRVPISVLRISNEFCIVGQDQSNTSDNVGMVRFIYNDTEGFDNVIHYMNSKDALVIIDKKNEYYLTSQSARPHIPNQLKDVISYGPCRDARDAELYVNSVCLDLFDELKKHDYEKSVRNVVKKHNLGQTLKNANAFGIFYEFAKNSVNTQQGNAQPIKSIESVKGLESDVVFFVLSNSFVKYLDGKEVANAQKHNKEWNKIYVALTRTKDKLVFVLDKRILNVEMQGLALEFFSRNDVSIIEDSSECLQWL